MEPNTFPQLQLWCPRPFGTYTQNKPCPAPATTATTTSTGSTTGTARKVFSCHPPAEVPIDASVPSENTPPVPAVPAVPAAAPPAGAAAPSGDAPPVPAAPPAEEGRVLLDTWYVIKPGNTKEKVAFFVAHQCGGSGAGIGAGISTGAGTASRATTMKVKGNWSTDSSKAKRRRRCHDPAKGQLSPSWAAAGGKDPAEPPGDANPDLLSVAEMVALVEQRTALALQSFPRPCAGTATPVVIVETSDGGAPSAPAAAAAATGGAGTAGADCKRVAEAVAHFESRHRELGTPRPNALCHPGTECGTAAANAPTPTTTAAAAPVPATSPGEVRIAFRISSTRDARGGASAAEPGTGGGGGRPNCVFMSCGPGGGGGGGGTARAKDKITCDLYQLISPSGDALPTNVELLLAAAGPKGDTDGTKAEPGRGEGSAGAAQAEAGEGGSGGDAAPGSARDCSSGFHVDVVVTGVVDQCVFYGKDSAKKVKEQTVKLPPQEEPPPPGQLFLLPAGGDEPGGGDDAGGGGGAAAAGGQEASSGGGGGGDPALCRLYRHVSHDFLEIRFKIQRLLEPRQYLLLLPEHLLVKIFSYLPTHALAALKCSCHCFKSLIETFGVQAADSRWSRDPLYRDDPCKQCRKRYQRGDVSLCRWHPKPYHHDLPYGRSYWMCCRRPDRDAPGCRVGLHDNNWVQPAPPRREEGR